MKSAAAAALGLLLLSAQTQGDTPPRLIEGTVVHVTDGDTLRIQPDAAGDAPLTLRLQDIDAPERCQAGGVQARDALAARVLHQHVQAVARATDDYQRTIAALRLNGEDIGAWMVLQGHAWAHSFGHRPAPYARQEAEARAAQRGVFADPQALEPRVFRQQHGACH